jgi:hypothetical protein
MNLSAMYEKNDINQLIPSNINLKKIEDFKNKTNYEEKINNKKNKKN